MYKHLFCWFPIILLPAVNIIIAIALKATYELGSALSLVIGAIVEELVFRWLILKKIFLSRLSPTLAIILVAILFAGLHFFNLRSGSDVSVILNQVLFAFCFSIWAGYVTYSSTFLIPLLAHVLLNLTATTDIGWVSLIVSIVVLVNGILFMKSDKVESNIVI